MTKPKNKKNIMTAPKNPNNNADANVINVPVKKRKNNNNY